MSRRFLSRDWLFYGGVVLLLTAGVVVLLVYSGRESRPRPAADAAFTALPDGRADTKTSAEATVATEELTAAAVVGPVDGNVGGPNDLRLSRDGAEEAAGEVTDVNSTAAEAGPRLAPLGFVIRGRVMSKDGPVRPVADVMGQWPISQTVEVSAAGYARTCEIDQEGRFQFSGLGPGSYVVSAAGGFLSDQSISRRLLCSPVEVLLDAERPTAEVVLVAGEGVPLPVVVTYEQTGSPVRSCWVSAVPIAGPGDSSRTDDQGCCMLNLLPGRYRVYARNREDESDSQTVVVQRSGGNPVVALEMPKPRPPKMIRGVLLDPQGNRIAGYVDISGVEWEAGAQPADSFRAPVPGYTPMDGFLGYAHDESGELARRFVWPEDGFYEEVKIVLEPRASIVGRVVDASGRPVSDAMLGLASFLPNGTRRDEEGFLYTLSMSGAGRFRFDGLAIGLKVQVTAYRGQALGQSDPLDLKAGATHDVGRIVLKVPKQPRWDSVVGGRITDEAGRPLADCRVIVQMQEPGFAVGHLFMTDAAGCFAATRLPEDKPVTATAKAQDGGEWFRTAASGDTDCDMRICPQGWDVLGGDAPALVVDGWVNHVPVTWEELRGRVVLLMFPGRDLGSQSSWSISPRNALGIYRQYAPEGLFMIVVYAHQPAGEAGAERVAQSISTSDFRGMPIAGCLDADPNLVEDFMPPARPAGASLGATRWLYQVSKPSAMFLVDKQGKVRCCVEMRDLQEKVRLLLKE